QQRRLPGAARARQEDEVSLVDLERQILEGVDAAAVRLRDVLRFDHPAFPSSSRVISVLTRAGLARPFVALITCPTRNPNVCFLPARYCATAVAWAASTSRTVAASAGSASIPPRPSTA